MAAHDHPSSGAMRRWPIILGWGLAVAALVVVVVVLLTRNSTTVVRTVIERVPAASAPVTQDTPAGALADAESFWAATDNVAGSDSYTLAYRLDGYSASAAKLTGWGVVTGNGGVTWQTLTVSVRYVNGRWQPVGVRSFVAAADPTVTPGSPQFHHTIATFHRFPGVP